jgi:hypothetical protein
MIAVEGTLSRPKKLRSFSIDFMSVALRAIRLNEICLLPEMFVF